jgi:hypothetical protein
MYKSGPMETPIYSQRQPIPIAMFKHHASNADRILSLLRKCHGQKRSMPFLRSQNGFLGVDGRFSSHPRVHVLPVFSVRMSQSTNPLHLLLLFSCRDIGARGFHGNWKFGIRYPRSVLNHTYYLHLSITYKAQTAGSCDTRSPSSQQVPRKPHGRLQCAGRSSPQSSPTTVGPSYAHLHAQTCAGHL